ncbi:retropepsin-like aspartic protease [Sphingomonas sp. CROZ-RG-20F-R02-07]|uniref:retropepsin-like aspartic protease n=1 Tax=Sphingomonas sp. CROZ-RG-20F-R02-07 TaxID=2914832 RepID=UPI001F59D192|nr:retropepsin-like aspartic protease [Sphingomonas sp. CROZ-RG-20F-R02-07]
MRFRKSVRIAALLSFMMVSAAATAGPVAGGKARFWSSGSNADVPMRIVDGRPVVEATIHGRGPFRLVIDTGFAGEMALSKDAAARMGLTRSGTMRVGDPSGRNTMDVEVYAVDDVRLGGIDFHAVTASALPPSRPSGGAVDGVVGIGLLRDLLLSFDYAGGRFAATRGSLAAAGDARTVRLARDPSGLVRLPVTVGGHDLDLDLDTGNGRSALSLPAEVVPALQTRGPARAIGMARTVSQEIPIMAVDLAAPVRVGGTTLGVSGITYPSPAPRGNIGSPAFAGTVLQIDLPHGLAKVTSSAPARP